MASIDQPTVAVPGDEVTHRARVDGRLVLTKYRVTACIGGRVYLQARNGVRRKVPARRLLSAPSWAVQRQLPGILDSPC